MALKKLLMLLIGLAMLGALHIPSVAIADSFTSSINVGGFIIPLNGEEGTLTVYSDGTRETSGFNVLGSQSFMLGAESHGSMTLNVEFDLPDFGNKILTSADLLITVDDLDFNDDIVTWQITLREMAVIDTVYGQVANINLFDFLPGGAATDTDDEIIALDAIPLVDLLGLTAQDLTGSGFFSFGLEAWVTNEGGPRWVTNTPENLLVSLTLNVEMTPVPEPGTVILLGSGMLGLIAWRTRRQWNT